MTEQLTAWAPRWTVAPGEILVEALAERHMSQAELSRRMARPLKTISEIATGKAAITPETAIQLEQVLGISASVWMGLESRYREALARERVRAELEGHLEWLGRFPLRDLIERGVLEDVGSPTEHAAQLLAFFGVSSPAGWQQHWGQIAANYRMRRGGRVSPEAVTVWLREGERSVEATALPAYDPTHLRRVMMEMRALSRAIVFAAALAAARERLATAGVGLVLIRGVTGAPVSGATRWVRDNPLIQLTLRHYVDDQFWFSLYHEAGHLLEGGRRRDVVEELPDGRSDALEERAADRFARDTLVPSEPLASFLAAGDLSRPAVREFAAEIGVAPGVVVGRLQRDRVVDWSYLNDLKRPLGERP